MPLAIYGNVKEQQSVLYAPRVYGSWSASLRYDVASHVALKTQVSRAQASNPQYWVTPSPTSNAYVNVYSVGADFVF
jgi:hypothetical protein